jgi:Na+/melibiose symporter-like transporter
MLSPAIAALTPRLFPRGRLSARMGRNAAFERAGNVAIALSIGAIGWLFPDRAVFLLVPALAIVSAAALFSIQREAIDARRARGGGDAPEPEPGAVPAGWRVLLGSRPLLIFAACVMLFHFANAPLLTLVAQEVGRQHPDWSSVIVSVCIVGAQAVMVPMALLVGRRADAWGRKPLLLIGFAALPLRAVLYTLSHDPLWLIGVQFLDGVGAGLLSAAKPLVLADLMRGTGRYNLGQGLVGTLQGAGAALSFVIAGALVQWAGFAAAYLACGAAALAALAVLVFWLPETAPEAPRGGPGAWLRTLLPGMA